MHEMHLLKDLFEDLLRHAEQRNIRKITKVYIRMGMLTEIDPDILIFFFREHSKGTVAEGAEIEIKSSESRELALDSFDGE